MRHVARCLEARKAYALRLIHGVDGACTVSVAVRGIARLFTTVLSFPSLVALALSFVIAFSVLRALAILDALLIGRAAAEAT